ncbi:MAG TPA: hypothetical protein IAC28_01095 [Candidatus Aphodovivens excrementavium]|nr:hypothetical protein [Candidatus Aphodovivens excrementavium]
MTTVENLRLQETPFRPTSWAKPASQTQTGVVGPSPPPQATILATIALNRRNLLLERKNIRFRATTHVAMHNKVYGNCFDQARCNCLTIKQSARQKDIRSQTNIFAIGAVFRSI